MYTYTVRLLFIEPVNQDIICHHFSLMKRDISKHFIRTLPMVRGRINDRNVTPETVSYRDKLGVVGVGLVQVGRG